MLLPRQRWSPHTEPPPSAERTLALAANESAALAGVPTTPTIGGPPPETTAHPEAVTPRERGPRSRSPTSSDSDSSMDPRVREAAASALASGELLDLLGTPLSQLVQPPAQAPTPAPPLQAEQATAPTSAAPTEEVAEASTGPQQTDDAAARQATEASIVGGQVPLATTAKAAAPRPQGAAPAAPPPSAPPVERAAKATAKPRPRGKAKPPPSPKPRARAARPKRQ